MNFVKWILARELNISNKYYIKDGSTFILTPYGSVFNEVYISGNISRFLENHDNNLNYTGIVNDITGGVFFKIIPSKIDKEIINALMDYSNGNILVSMVGEYVLDRKIFNEGNGSPDSYINVKTLKIIDEDHYYSWLLSAILDLIKRIDYLIDKSKDSTLDNFIFNGNKLNLIPVDIAKATLKEYEVNPDEILAIKKQLISDTKEKIYERYYKRNEDKILAVRDAIKKIYGTSKDISIDDLKKIIELDDRDLNFCLKVLNFEGEVLITKTGIRVV
jgi:RPA family protein